MSADLALIDGNVITMNTDQPRAQAIATKEGKILRVGTNEEVNQTISNNTKVLNLDGKTVLPGLIDTHIHVADFGRCLMWLDLTSAQSISDLQLMISKKASEISAGKWIIGQGWNENRLKKLPTSTDLDAAAPNNPVIIYREAAMICVVNSKAFQVTGITKESTVPQGGSIDKDPSTGCLTGVLRDTATNLVWQAVPEPTFSDLLDGTAIALRKIVEIGLTSIHWFVLSEVELEIIQELHDKGKLLVRVDVVVPENLMEKAQKLKTSDLLMLRFSGVTVNVDGYLDSKEAALSEPYNDDPNNRGKLLCTEEALKNSVQRILAAKVQPIIVAMGDKAIDETLRVIEKNPIGNHRFRMEQAAILNAELVKRMQKQPVVVSIQPKMISTEFTVWSAKERLGLERAKWLHPLKTLIDAGVKIAGGSDCPMEPLNPMLGMQEVVARESFPEQRLSVEEAIRMYTLDAAYSANEENKKGSIEEGKLADLTVLSSNLNVFEYNKIKDVNVNFTIIGGKIQSR